MTSKCMLLDLRKIFGPFENLDAQSREKYAITAAFINAKLA
jgi:hypothetical protein